jgi:hypothetical protein
MKVLKESHNLDGKNRRALNATPELASAEK